jgi:hypothetical protein
MKYISINLNSQLIFLTTFCPCSNPNSSYRVWWAQVEYNFPQVWNSAPKISFGYSYIRFIRIFGSNFKKIRKISISKQQKKSMTSTREV